MVNPCTAKHEYSRFQLIVLLYQIAVIGKETSALTSKFANVWSRIRQI